MVRGFGASPTPADAAGHPIRDVRADFAGTVPLAMTGAQLAGRRGSMQTLRMVKKLLHTRMRVNDIERTVKFYEQALELKVARRSISPRGAQIVFLATPNSDEEIEICQLPNSPSVQVQPDLMHLAFEVDDLAVFTKQIEKKGYKLSDGPTPTGSGSTIAFIDAPEGYEVELIQRGK
jgi:lactoylglutathione lyase